VASDQRLSREVRRKLTDVTAEFGLEGRLENGKCHVIWAVDSVNLRYPVVGRLSGRSLHNMVAYLRRALRERTEKK